METRKLLNRAGFAFFKDLRNHPNIARHSFWPLYETSGLYRYNTRDYVILKTQSGRILAVYRIRPTTGYLRRLFNYPRALDSEPAPGNPLYKKIENKT